jgi:hypothetical protein
LNNLQTDKAPSLQVVVPPFIFGALSFFILTILILLAGSDMLGPYFAGKMLAITHLAVLGWSTMIVLGALYQLVPVVFETALFSEKLAKVTFWSFAVSIILLVYAFWNSDFGIFLIYAASLMFSSLTLFVINILLSKSNGKRNIQSWYVSSAVTWLLLTALLGLLMAFNFKYTFFSQIHLHYLKIHAHLGLIGWFVSLIVGISSTLIPMFLVSHQLDENKLKVAFYLINGGLALLSLDWLILGGTLLVPAYWLAISCGILFYLAFIKDAYKKRLRKGLDTGMKYTMLAILSMLVPIILSILILLISDIESSFLLNATTLYGFSIIFGLITPIILGQTYKTLPFIIWLSKYKEYVGKHKTAMPKDLYSEIVGIVQLYMYYGALGALINALIFQVSWMITVGSYALLLVAILYNVNVFKIIFHKIKLESLTS